MPITIVSVVLFREKNQNCYCQSWESLVWHHIGRSGGLHTGTLARQELSAKNCIMKDKAEEELEAKGTEDGSGPAQGRGGGVGKTGAPSC